jgi:hypothetical protein
MNKNTSNTSEAAAAVTARAQHIPEFPALYTSIKRVSQHVVLREPDGAVVAEITLHGYRRPSSEPCQEEYARLFAAAPDLLAALIHAKAALEDVKKFVGSRWIYADAERAADAAIAKAEGRDA